MCHTTLYDSPTCGHTWLSLSTPCTFLADLLSCPIRTTTCTLIAPPHACPICNRAFACPETIEMVQGPWGCNQMIRSHVGGQYAIPGSWGNVQLGMGPALTSGHAGGMGRGGMMGYGNGFTYDHRLTGPYGAGGMMQGAPLMITNGPVVCDEYAYCDDGYIHDGYLIDNCDYGWDYGRGRSRSRSSSRHKSKYKYRYTDRPATNCVVM